MMNTSEMKKKGIKGVKTIIFGRTLMVVFAFVIQFLLLISIYIWLRDYSYIFYLVFVLLSVTVVLHLFNSSGSPEFKLVWMLPLIIFPVFGALFYIYIGTQLGTKMLFRRLESLSVFTRKYVPQNEKVKETLEAVNPQIGHFADYMEEYGNAPVYDHTQVKYYPLGDDQFEDMLEELRKAEKFIFLEFFIVEEGVMWNSILDILKEKAKNGVEVRVMYDGMCVLALLPYFYPKMLEAEGIRCKMFAPIRPVFSTYYNNRDHRKIMVIDGKVAFTGGTNLADEYINQKVRFGHWKDTAVRLTGKAVERFTYMFLEMWDVTETEEENYENYKTPKEFSVNNDGFIMPYEVSPYGKERVVINDILIEIAEELEIMPEEERMMLHTDFNKEVEVEGNLSLIGSIFRNLTENAIAYSGGKNIYISLIENNENWCKIRFEDDGCGVEDKQLSRLFERFYRVDKGRSRQLGATGLGLSIVKHAVQFHGGTITASNRQGGGLQFDFSLRKH